MKIATVLLFLFFLPLSQSAKGQIKSTTIDSLRNEISSLKEHINLIESRQTFLGNQIDSQTGMLDTAFDGVSSTLSASSNFIGVFGIIIAIFSIGLSIYVARIEKNVRAMKADSEILLQKNIQIKDDLETLSKKITKDSSGLYKMIRNEESNHILERLISVPEDITNLFYSLASRDLEKDHFAKIKEAFLQLSEKGEGYGDYLTLFFQHFSDLCLLDKDIKPKFLKSIDENFSIAFKNDVLKSASDFFNAIIELTIPKSISEINQYVLALCKSKFAEHEAIYYAINNAMKNRENKFDLYDAISKAPDYLTFRKKFGLLLLDYKFENMTPKEEAIIEDIKNITTV